MEVSSDPYEQKLFQMFQSCDTDRSGLLDETALRQLCEMLELRDNGSVLIDDLARARGGNAKSRVSFVTFKEALLNFLGTELDGTKTPISATQQRAQSTKFGGSSNSIIKGERTLFISDEVETYIDSPPESSDREVSPKLVVGSKKYGRRSRPHLQGNDTSPSDSEETETVITSNGCNNFVQRSSSQTDIADGRRRRPMVGGNKLKRCASLPAQKNQRARESIVRKNKSSMTQTTKDSSLLAQQKLSTSVESLGNLDFENLTNTIHVIWRSLGSEIGTNYLSCQQLQIVCERVGLLPKVAERVAVECFEKLGPVGSCDLRNKVITFREFMNLLHGHDADHNGTHSLVPVVALPSSTPPTNDFLNEFHLAVVAAHGNTMARTNNSYACNTTTTTNLSNSNKLGSTAKDIPMQMETLSAQSIIEIWDRANISNGKGILLMLGFDEDEINLSQLSKVLEEELRSLEGESQLMLLKASLTLQSAELTALRQTFRQLRDENKKLHSDNKDANQRVAMLAQEIDERHASLEDTTKKEIRMLEQRHAEVVRDLTFRMANDRENWTNLNTRLEAKLKSFEQEEVKMRTELDLIRKENSALEGDQQSLQKQITDLLEANIKLNREITEMEDRTRTDEHVNISLDKSTSDDVLNLVEKISALQMENANLRDKNDELVSEVESLNVELTRAKAKSKKSSSSTSSATLECNELSLDELESGAMSTAIKRRGDSPSKTRITEESPRLGKLRKCANNADASETSDTSGDWVALNSELQNSGAATTASSSAFASPPDDDDTTALKQRISELEEELKSLKEVASTSTEERCKELESSLEQMQKAYEDCEDYWQSKLAEERQLFDKERQIYEDEQQESDKKFTELMEKVREYEEQFSKDGRLSPIEEKDTLEQQYADLEAEAEEIRENARVIFEEKTKEIESLQNEIEDLRMRLGESVEILTGANEMNSEAAHKGPEMASPANSPISYLWHQSTIQSPAKEYQAQENSSMSSLSSPSKQRNRINLSTSETAIFSTTPIETIPSTSSSNTQNISPIQKPTAPKSPPSEGDAGDCDSSSTISGKSFESRSVASTHSVHHSHINNNMQNDKKNPTSSSHAPSSCSSPSPSPSGIKEELKRLKFFEISLKEQIKDLSLQRDGLVMELQQLQEARPVLEKAYARTAHPTLIQRVNQLELKNRHLQNVIKQQQQYTEGLMQQTWQQHHNELADLRNRIEGQGMMMAEQSQRLQNADILVKELYIENSHLTATVQRLEQQRTRANLIHQHQGLSGLPGMP